MDITVSEFLEPEAPVEHPVEIMLPGVHYCTLNNPPWGEAIVLGFQHCLVATGSIAMISYIVTHSMGGGDVERSEVTSNMLFVSAISTLVQSFFGTRLPVLMGNSYAYIIPSLYISLLKGNNITNTTERFQDSMRAVQGSLIIASIFHMLIGFGGVWRIFARYLNPLSAVPLVVFTGLGLCSYGFPELGRCFEVGLPALIHKAKHKTKQKCYV